MKKLLLLFLCSVFLVFSVQALIEAPEEYQIKMDSKKAKKTERVKKVNIPSFDETVVEVQEEVLPQEKPAVTTEKKSFLSTWAKIINLVLILAIVVLASWLLINRKKT